MHDLIARLQGQGPSDTPLDRAQELMYQAFEERNPKRRVQLAKEALAISPDCADACVLLAEHAGSHKEAIDWYEKGVAAGERALGPETFQRDVGHFWGMLETRPYMRARQGLAMTLWSAGRRDEAVQHLQEMLRLNPSDNQGVRYTLAGFLLFLDRDDDLARLLHQYKDDAMAAWAYTRALLAFRQHGDTPEAQKLLKKALKTNKHVPDYLLGDKYPPNEEPSYYSPGDESEALNYVGSFMVGWKDTPGAIDWLRAQVKPRKKEPAPHAKGPLSFIKKWLTTHLRQEPDVWQAACRPVPNWISVGGEMVRPWSILITSNSNELILGHQLLSEPPSDALLWDTLVQAMQNPMAGEAHRPTEIQVRADEPWAPLKPHLEEIGVDLVVGQDFRPLDAIFWAVFEELCGKPQPGLLDAPGVTPEQVGRFYEAAALFFRQAPWKKVGYESAVRVECDKFHSGPWYAVLMGQSGLMRGVALYEDLKALRRLWARDDDEENARRTVGTSVTYGEEWSIPASDFDAAKKYGWPVARSDAYPDVFHKERGLSRRPPLVWELELLEGCLRCVPDFVSRRKQDDTTREEFTVPAGSGELKLVLSWISDEDK